MLAILLPSRLLSLEICRRKLLGFHPRLESIRVSRITRIVRFTRTAASGYPNSPNNRTTPIIRTLFVILKPNRGGDPNTSNIWLYPPSGNRISFGLSLENARTAETHATSNTTERERTRLNNLGGATRRRRRHDRDIDKVDDTPGSALTRGRSQTDPIRCRSMSSTPIGLCQEGDADCRGEPTWPPESALWGLSSSRLSYRSSRTSAQIRRTSRCSAKKRRTVECPADAKA